MKIVHLNTSNQGGGAAIAAMRHSEALQHSGFDSTLISMKGKSKEGCIVLGQNKIHWFSLALLFHIIKRIKKVGISWNLLLFGKSILKYKDVANADIIVLHYINDFLNYRTIYQLLKSGKHIIWFMHDMWPMTGGCHHALDCEGYKTNCSNCPQLKRAKWVSKWQHKKKRDIFSNPNLKIVSPSTWLANCLKESSLFKNSDIKVFPNVINTDIYKPIDKNIAKEKLGLSRNKKYILFGAATMESAYKGMSYIYKILTQLDSNYEFIVMGNLLKTEYPNSLLKRTHEMGFVNGDEEKSIIYNAADIFLITSIAENYPNMIIESMACGTPVVGFSVGGIAEQVKHKNTGYLAPIGNINEILFGINWVFANNRDAHLSKAASSFVNKTCSYKMIRELYTSYL